MWAYLPPRCVHYPWLAPTLLLKSIPKNKTSLLLVARDPLASLVSKENMTKKDFNLKLKRWEDGRKKKGKIDKAVMKLSMALSL